jgi:C-terminal processing protease CtpA/Prc
MEFDAGVPGQQFYRPYLQTEAVENRVLDVDLKIVSESMREKYPTANPERVVNRIRDHYLDSSRLIKRSFGEVQEDDFQHYNWGLVLTHDVSMDSDKLELLILTYSKDMPRRCSLLDFQEIMQKHTTFRHITEKRDKREKWMDLVMSFKLNSISKKKFPDSIGKREFELIVDINGLAFDIDFLKLTTDMRKTDKYSNRLHMLLVHDPLIDADKEFTMHDLSLPFKQHKTGAASTSNNKVSDDHAPSDWTRLERMKEFEKYLELEEAENSNFERKQRLETAFDTEKKLQEQRAARKAQRDAEKAAAAAIERAEKEAQVQRLRQIIADREAYEAQKRESYKERIAEMNRQEVERATRLKSQKLDGEVAVAAVPDPDEEEQRPDTAQSAVSTMTMTAPDMSETVTDLSMTTESPSQIEHTIRIMEPQMNEEEDDARSSLVFDPNNPNLAAYRETRRLEKLRLKEEQNRIIQEKLARHKEKKEKGHYQPAYLGGKSSSSADSGVKRSQSVKDTTATTDTENIAGAMFVPKMNTLFSASSSARPSSASKRLAVKDVIAGARQELQQPRPHTTQQRSMSLEDQAVKKVKLAEKPSTASAAIAMMVGEGVESLEFNPEDDLVNFLFDGSIDKDRIERLRKQRLEEENARQSRLREEELRKEQLAKKHQEDEIKRKLRAEEAEIRKEKAKKLKADRLAETAALRALEEEIRLEAEAKAAQAAAKAEEEHRVKLQAAKENEELEEHLRAEKEKIRKLAALTKAKQDEEKKKEQTKKALEIKEAKARAVLQEQKHQQQLRKEMKEKERLRHIEHQQLRKEKEQITDVESDVGHSDPSAAMSELPSKEEASADSDEAAASEATVQQSTDSGSDRIPSEVLPTDSVGVAYIAYDDIVQEAAVQMIPVATELLPQAQASPMDLIAYARAVREQRLGVVQGNLSEYRQENHPNPEVPRSSPVQEQAPVDSYSESAAAQQRAISPSSAAAPRSGSRSAAPQRSSPHPPDQSQQASKQQKQRLASRSPSPQQGRASPQAVRQSPGSRPRSAAEVVSAKLVTPGARGRSKSPTTTSQTSTDASVAGRPRSGSHLAASKAATGAHGGRSQSPTNRSHGAPPLPETISHPPVAHSKPALTSKPHPHADEKVKSHSHGDDKSKPHAAASPHHKAQGHDVHPQPAAKTVPHKLSKDHPATHPATQGEPSAAVATALAPSPTHHAHGKSTGHAKTSATHTTTRKSTTAASKQGIAANQTPAPARLEDLKTFEILHNVEIPEQIEPLKADQISVGDGMDSIRERSLSLSSDSSGDSSSYYTSQSFQSFQSLQTSILSLKEYLSMPFEELRFEVPKTDGELKLVIRHDDEGLATESEMENDVDDSMSCHGLFIHGFKPNSNAERQGLLAIGDELIMINNVVVKGKYLQDIVEAIKTGNEHRDTVNVTIRRRVVRVVAPSPRVGGNISVSQQSQHSLPSIQEIQSPVKPVADDSHVAGDDGISLVSDIRDDEYSASLQSNSLMYSSRSNYSSIISDMDHTINYDMLLLMIPLTNGELRVILRHIDDVSAAGPGVTVPTRNSRIVVHGFKPSSNAELQGALHIEDELLAVNNISVEGKHLDAVISAVRQLPAGAAEVSMLVRRQRPRTVGDSIDSLQDHHHENTVSVLISPLESPRMDPYPSANIISSQQPGIYVTEMDVPKTNGELRVILRQHDNDDLGQVSHSVEQYGVFVHGFKAYSAAERQGLLRIGDEIVKVNGVSVLDLPINEIAQLISSNDDSVHLHVRRRQQLQQTEVARGSETTGDGLSMVLSPRPAQASISISSPRAKPTVLTEFDSPGGKLITILVPKSGGSIGELGVLLKYDTLARSEVGSSRRPLSPYSPGKSTKLTAGAGLFVHAIKPGTEAEAQGLIQVGDHIVAVDDINVEGKYLEPVVRIILRNTHEHVKFTVRRGGPGSTSRPITGPQSIKAPSARQVSNKLEARKSFRMSQKSLPTSPVKNESMEPPQTAPSNSSSVTLLEFEVPKTNGELRLILSQNVGDDIATLVSGDSSQCGLFIHGFKAFCAAENQGLLRIGDEIIQVNGTSVIDNPAAELAELISGDSDNVRVQVRRRPTQKHPSEPAPLLGDGLSVVLSPRPVVTVTNIMSPRPQAESKSDVVSSQKVGNSNIITISVPKTGGCEGQLGVLIKHDAMRGDGPTSTPPYSPGMSNKSAAGGLFVHAIRPGSAAEAQGLIQVGDQVIAVDDTNVEGRYLEPVVRIIMRNDQDYVKLTVRRGAPGSPSRPTVGAESTKAPTARQLSYKMEVRKSFRMSQKLLASSPTKSEINNDSGDIFIASKTEPLSPARSLQTHPEEEQVVPSLVPAAVPVQVLSAVHTPREVEPQAEQVQTEQAVAPAPTSPVSASPPSSSPPMSTPGQSHGASQEIAPSTATPRTALVLSLTPRMASATGVSNSRRSSNKSEKSSTSLSNVFASDEMFDIVVPKTDGELRVLLRHDLVPVTLSTEAGTTGRGAVEMRPGLFIHGIRADSRAKEQGLLRVGDELIAVNGVIVQGGYLEDVIAVLQQPPAQHQQSNVVMTIRRVENGYGILAEEDLLGDTFKDVLTINEVIERLASSAIETDEADAGSVLSTVRNNDIYDVTVPKTNGQLAILLRHDIVSIDDQAFSTRPGLFIHGIKPNSNAAALKAQGLLRAGDELIAINGVRVEGGYLEDVIAVLEPHHSPKKPGSREAVTDSVILSIRRVAGGHGILDDYETERDSFARVPSAMEVVHYMHGVKDSETDDAFDDSTIASANSLDISETAHGAASAPVAAVSGEDAAAVVTVTKKRDDKSILLSGKKVAAATAPASKSGKQPTTKPIQDTVDVGIVDEEVSDHHFGDHYSVHRLKVIKTKGEMRVFIKANEVFKHHDGRIIDDDDDDDDDVSVNKKGPHHHSHTEFVVIGFPVGSKAAKQGLIKQGDEIIAIDDVAMPAHSIKTVQQLSQLLKESSLAGTEYVHLTVKRKLPSVGR